MNYSEDLLKKQIKENLAIRKLIDEKIASKISVSDEEIKDYYENNQDEFKNPEKVHARHILVKSQQDASDEKKAEARKKIEEVQKKLEQGNDFSELAKEYSEGPSSKKGGDLGYFSHGQMVEKFDKAAFALEPGETSDIVETRFGYHIIKVEDKKSESMKSLDKVRDSIRENLRNEKLMQELEPYIASLKKKYPVEKNLPETGGDKQQ
ncbi:MAG: peptidyl-prolyl cis-trans isomerase [Desulfobacterales bacterium]|nr:peptidyl-prolyl cis-trans isomerase [Desulfobacterales bacterium]